MPFSLLLIGMLRCSYPSLFAWPVSWRIALSSGRAVKLVALTDVLQLLLGATGIAGGADSETACFGPSFVLASVKAVVASGPHAIGSLLCMCLFALTGCFSAGLFLSVKEVTLVNLKGVPLLEIRRVIKHAP